MRVIAGQHRGRSLKAPPGDRTRPTSDRVREALFSVLGEVAGMRVLDLFAGSGALAIEALSRGAAEAVLVESDRRAAQTIASMSMPVAMMTKETINRADEVSLSEGVRFERRVFHAMFATADQKEGMAAFVEKRKAEFKDR